uniref:Inner nuclear membrane protein Man1 n=1 Tax=Lygus hesperus TaxID=30085 RepID=A0A0A9XRE3_LYGHE
MNLDNLSDAQIRAKFIELGVPVGPVTATTRKYMIKKLKSLLDSGAKPPSTSGEESDGGRLTPRARRKTAPPKPVAAVRSPRRKTTMEPIASSTIIEPRATRRSTRDSFNESDDVPGKYTPSNAQKIGNEAFRASLNALPNSYHSSPNNSYSSSMDEADTRSNTPTLESGYPDVPFASEFLRRLSSGRKDASSPLSTGLSSPTTSTSFVSSPSLSSGLSRKLLDVKESDDEDSGPPPNYSKFSTGRVVRDSANSKGYRRTTTSDSWFFLDSPISALLIALFVLFFGALGVVYVNKTTSEGALTTPLDFDYTICDDLRNHIADVNCVNDEDRTYVDLMINIVLAELADRLSAASCLSSSVALSDNELLNVVLRKDRTLSYYVVEKNLNNLKIIFANNPKLNIKPTKDGIELIDVPQSLYCTGISFATLAADWVIKISIGFLISLAVFVAARWWIRREARHKEEVYKLVGNIIEIVSSKSVSSESFVPISHVRDQLIPLKDRPKMKRLWEDALKLLETDSRLRREVQEVEGEHFMVWRWLAANLTTNKKKVWQGQAFDTLEGNLNSHVESPTNCLKIRHMFEAGAEEGEEWVTTVVDAILEKCGSAKILHLVVDRQSAEGLVYIKCATPADAGAAYRSLHGSWFASNLITVKYIREHRYHERFPDSVNCTKPLRPSNDYQRSLQ